MKKYLNETCLTKICFLFSSYLFSMKMTTPHFHQKQVTGVVFSFENFKSNYFFYEFEIFKWWIFKGQIDPGD